MGGEGRPGCVDQSLAVGTRVGPETLVGAVVRVDVRVPGAHVSHSSDKWKGSLTYLVGSSRLSLMSRQSSTGL